jgi:hypothetical protein
MKNVEALIDDITLGRLPPFDCAATAADGHNAIAMLVRRDGEDLNELLERLDEAIARFYADGEVTDEINGPST